MKKTIVMQDIDPQFTSVGCVFKTNYDDFRVVDASTLVSLLEKKKQLEDKVWNSFLMGKALNIANDDKNISNVWALLSHDGCDTRKVILDKDEFMELLQCSQSTMVSQSMISNMQNRLNSASEVYKKSEEKNKQLKSQIEELQKKLREKDMTEYQSTKSNDISDAFSEARLKLNAKRKESKDTKATLILELAVSGYNASQIQCMLAEQYEIEVALATIYRALSVRKSEDRKRIVTLYRSNIAGKGKCSLEDVVKWYERIRNKKLKLKSGQDEDSLNSFGEECML